MAKVFKLEGYIFGALRRIWKWHPVKKEALRQAAGKCVECGVVAEKLHVDHINPVVAVTGFVDWNTYIDRLFCGVGNLAVLCKDCHQVKTQAENAERRKLRPKKEKKKK